MGVTEKYSEFVERAQQSRHLPCRKGLVLRWDIDETDGQATLLEVRVP